MAERCRPRRLRDFVGHEEIIGPGTPLRESIKLNRLKSLILWGPPGVGKTTLARIIANEVQADFIGISAVAAGVKEIRQTIDRAKKNRRHFNKSTILFIDEIHRFNKAQQDALLHVVEDGTLVLIGATTENPSFEVNSPLLSRCQVYQMKPLQEQHIQQIVEQALTRDALLKSRQIEITDWPALITLAGGDARRALNTIEKALDLLEDVSPPLKLDARVFEKAAQQKILYYDKSGEFHYDLISAFIKSVRGSDPDAALYWMSRMLAAGEDPKFIARRMIILASEDIGNADPQALTLAVSCFTAASYIGMPEAQIVLAQAATYLASAPKSNASYLGLRAALQEVKDHPEVQTPLHLRNAPTHLMKKLDYGKGYRYPHDSENHFIPQKYLPEPLQGHVYYQPSSEGAEQSIRQRLKELWRGVKSYKENTKGENENHE